MKKFMITYHAPDELLAQTANPDPEEAAKGMEPWMAWAKKCGKHLVDLGNPLTDGQTLHHDGSSEASKRQVCGYSMLQAENMEEARKLLAGHPHLEWDASCEIEVHESLPMPG